MSVEKYNIEIAKQNYKIINLSVKKDGKAIKLGKNDLIFMTVGSDEKTKFQKTLGNGISYNEDTKKYEIEIKSEDTKNMEINSKYGYDITIYYDGDKPSQKIIGEFIINKSYTLNEVV